VTRWSIQVRRVKVLAGKRSERSRWSFVLVTRYWAVAGTGPSSFRWRSRRGRATAITSTLRCVVKQLILFVRPEVIEESESVDTHFSLHDVLLLFNFQIVTIGGCNLFYYKNDGASSRWLHSCRFPLEQRGSKQTTFHLFIITIMMQTVSCWNLPAISRNATT